MHSAGAPLRLEITRSRLLAGYLVVVYSVVAAVTVWGIARFDLSLFFSIVFAICALTLLAYAAYQNQKNALCNGTLHVSGNQITLTTNNGINRHGRLSSSTIWPFVVVLHADGQKQNINLPIFIDQLDSDEWRKLRVYAATAKLVRTTN